MGAHVTALPAAALAAWLAGLTAAPAQPFVTGLPSSAVDPHEIRLPGPGDLELPPPVAVVPSRPPRPDEVGELRNADQDSWPDWEAALRNTFGAIPASLAQRFDPADTFDVDGTLPRPFRILSIQFLVDDSQPEGGQLDVALMEDEGGHKPDRTRPLGPGPVTVTDIRRGVNVVDVSAWDVIIDDARMFHVVFSGLARTGPLVAADDGLPNPGGTGDMHASVLICEDNCHPGCSPQVFGLFLTAAPDGSTRGNNLMTWLTVDFLDAPPEPLFVRHEGIEGCNRCAWGDVDGDGDLDGLANGRRLWRNEGDGTFTEVTAAAGLSGLRSTGGGLFGDFDRDGDLDIFAQTGECTPCQRSAPPNFDTLLRNLGDTDGDGVPEFEDVRLVDHGNADDAPVPGDDLPTEGAAVADVNGDGHLDVYLANHVDWDDGRCWPDALWLNDGLGDLSFTDVTARAGMTSPVLCGRGVTPGDHDGDGDVDLFVSNYRLNADLLWENRSGWDELDVPRFVDVAMDRGVAGLERLGAYGHGIGSAWGDVDEDGDQDLIVGNLAHSNWLCFSDTTKLFLSSGAAGGFTFDDARPQSGIGYNEVHSDASFADIDNDGDLDVLITHVYDGWRTSLYRNLGDLDLDGVPDFEDVFAISGIGQRSAWGSAWGDFDGDGDLDAWMRGGLYVNRAADSGATTWLKVRLRSTVSNPQSIGARATVEAGGRTLLREVVGARGTSSQDAFDLHFGLGGLTTADRIHVTWPSGCDAEMIGVDAGQLVEIVEPACLVARFRIESASGSAGRPVRVACVGTTVTFVDDSSGDPVAWEWDFDGDGLADATGPRVEWTGLLPGLHDVTLTVDDGTLRDTVTRPVRIDEPPVPPASGSVTEQDANFCEPGLRVSWEPAGWGAAVTGVYDLYRGLDAADALTRPPIVTGLGAPTYLDVDTDAGVPYTYVVVAEDALEPGGCEPGPHHGGNTSALVLDPGVVDLIKRPRMGPVRVSDADPCAPGGILVEWDPATFYGPSGSGTYHVYRAEGRCPIARLFESPDGDEPLVLGLTGTSFVDETAVPGAAYTYLVQAEDEAPWLFCESGPRNRGPSRSSCAEGQVTDEVRTASADPGAVLRASSEPGGAVALSWSETLASPADGEAWAALFADGPTGPWGLLEPGRLAAPTTRDVGASSVMDRYYLATVVDPLGCPASDPFRP